VNLPNKESLREHYGSKNMIAVSVTDVRQAVQGDKEIREFVWPEKAAEAARCWRQVKFAEVAFHELMGHASGKVDPKLKQDSRQAIAPYFSALEEARADLVGYHHFADPKTTEIGIFSDAKCAEVAPYAIAAWMFTYLRVVDKGDLAEEDHLRGHLLLQGWQTDRGAIRIVERNGKHYVEIIDMAKWKEGVASLLTELQRIKANGDKAAIQALIEKYATHINPALRDEVVARTQALGLPSRMAYLPPILEAVRDAKGEITDVTARPARNVDDVIDAFDAAGAR
jgi:dipeptidyl-peptidase-3